MSGGENRAGVDFLMVCGRSISFIDVYRDRFWGKTGAVLLSDDRLDLETEGDRGGRSPTEPMDGVDAAHKKPCVS
jgi:hypothetical protein